MTTTRTWKVAHDEVKVDLDRAVARNSELADRVGELEGTVEGLRNGNRQIRQESNRLNSENNRLTRELERSESELLLEERKKHKQQLEEIRDGKVTASQLLSQLGEQGAKSSGEELLR